MNPLISSEHIRWFFALAPFVLGTGIYAIVWLFKRDETATFAPMGRSFTCATCGRRSVREHMLAQIHAGATGWICARCAKGR